jgi:ionotropic glutamate receptor
MELQQSGLIDYWDTWFRPMPLQCLGKIQYGYKAPNKNEHPPLSLKNLTGAFIILSVGLSLSLLAFLCEKILFLFKRHCHQLH